MLRDRFEQEVVVSFAAAVNGRNCTRIPNTSNIHLPGLDGDGLVMFLDQRGICISSGSACLESAITPSHVILAMTGSHDRANESIRISIGLNTSETELLNIKYAIDEFAAITA
jgi:cysteine desulfurase